MSILEQLFPSEAPALAWPSGLPDHLSASQLNMFSRCPEQYRRRYVLGEKERPAAALVWGSADHYAHEQNFAQKILSGEDIPGDDVKLAFAEGFDRAVDRSGGEGEVDWGQDKPGEMKDRGAALVGVYHKQVSPRIQPTAVETKFKVDLPGVPVPVIGYVDVSTAATAIERKTAGRAEKKPKPDWRIQGLLYQAVGGKPVEWHVSVKTKTPAVWTPLEAPDLQLALNSVTVGATKGLVRTIAQGLLAYWTTYGPDEPWPGAVTHPWACDFCGFRPTCAWWAGENEPTDPLSFGDTLAGVTATPAALEAERLVLTRTLLDIGDKRGSLPTVVAAIDSNMKSRPLAEHVAWLQAQLERATEVIA
jgi:hypothetical protein